MQLIPNLLIIPVGIVIGVLVAAPVGPVNVLCIQRAIERGFWGGMAAGIGAMLGDGLIALFASLGVGAISGAIEYHRQSIQIVGGLALIAFGVKLYVSPPGLAAVRTRGGWRGIAARLRLGHPENVLPHHHQSGRGAWALRDLRRHQLVRRSAQLRRCAHHGGVDHGRKFHVVAGAVAPDRPPAPQIQRRPSRLHEPRSRSLCCCGFGALLIGEELWNRLALTRQRRGSSRRTGSQTPRNRSARSRICREGPAGAAATGRHGPA